MASQMVTVTVKYSKPGTVPPIYLAGSFSHPEWQPEEMQYTTNENNEYEFHAKVEVEHGKEYQYKFRLGAGDWWTLNEDSPTVTDDLGNKNNLLSMPKIEETTTNTEESMETTHEHQAKKAETPPAPAMEKEATPSIEETMGTREIDDTLFADEITPHTNEEKPEPNSIATLGVIETTPAVLDKPEIVEVEEVNHSRESQDIRGTDTEMDKLDEKEGVVEPTPTPLMQFKKLLLDSLDDTDSQNASDQEEEEKAIAPPALVVDHAEEKSKHDDNPEAATQNRTSTNLLTTKSTEEAARAGARTPDLANVAAEVADVAATLDPEEPTPPVSDEEAGRTGFRRMSTTPIPEVANTAAEVADSAAIIDDEADGTEDDLKEPKEFIRPFDIDDGDLPETPPNERVPRFSHECISPPRTRSPSPHERKPMEEEEFDPYKGMRPRAQEEIDLNDPRIQMFPTDRAGIMEHLNRMQARLPPDEVKLDLAPPVVGPNGRALSLPPVSPVTLAVRSPSLDSVPEQNEEEDGRPELIKLNNEDKPTTNGITISKEETDTMVGHTFKENETPHLEPEIKSRDLEGSVDGGSEKSPLPTRLEVMVTETTESHYSDDVEEDSQSPTKVENVQTVEVSNQASSAESGNATPFEVDEGTGTAEESNPVAISETISGEKSAKQRLNEEMDGICEEGSHVVPSPFTPFIVGNRQLGQEDEDIEDLSSNSVGPSITVQPATPFLGIDRQLGNDENKDVKATEESIAKDARSSVIEVTTPPSTGTSATTDSTIKHNNHAKSTAIEEDEAPAKLRQRAVSPTRRPDTPNTPKSIRSKSKDRSDVNSEGFLKKIFRVVFVDWLGALVMRLCGGRGRRQ